MANVIKLKRGSGSDPSASDLVVGEVAIRTDSGKLFTKKDNGTIAEISGSGGGSDIFINTLSSSSGSGGNVSGVFDSLATRFTLSNPPAVSAQQLLVSINGVIQKPNSGTSPSEGFAIDGNDIIFAAAPATGADFFIVTYGSLNIAVPADNSVTSAKIADGAIVNADINANAAIDGDKIAPTFTSAVSISSTTPTLNFTETDANPDYRIVTGGGEFVIQNDQSGSFATRFKVNADGHVDVTGNLDVGAGLDITGAITGTGDLTIDTNTLHVDSSNNRVGIGTTSPAMPLHIKSDTPYIRFEDDNDNQDWQIEARGFFSIYDVTDSAHRLAIDGNGNVGIGTTSPGTDLHIQDTSANPTIRLSSANNGICELQFGDQADTVRGNIVYRNGTAGDALCFNGYNNIESMRIDSAGRVGIDTISPLTKLVVSNGGAEGLEVNPLLGTVELSAYNRNTTARSPLDIVGKHFKVLTGNPSLSTGLYQDSDGNVGIGTTSPDQLLHLSAASNPLIRIENTDTTLVGDQIIGGIEFEKQDSSGAGVGVVGGLKCRSGSGTGASAYLEFSTSDTSTNNQERMRIDSSGRVMIGVMDTNHASANADDLCVGNNDSSSEHGITIGSNVAGSIRWADSASGGAGIINYEHGTTDAMTFYTDGSLRMSIDSNGRVGINVTTLYNVFEVKNTSNTIHPARFLMVGAHQYAPIITDNDGANGSGGATFLTCRMSNSIKGDIVFNGSVMVYGGQSDYRLKENVVSINDGIAKIKQLNPLRYNFIDNPDQTCEGFFAHEAQAVCPQSATGTKDEIATEDLDSAIKKGDPVYQQMDYSKLVPLLTAGLKEAIVKIETLETKVAALEAS